MIGKSTEPGIMTLELRPITLRAANQFVSRHHRHHGPTVGHKFSISCWSANQLVGVVIVGRPSARNLDDGFTAEALRLCTDGNVKNVASKLYAAAWRASRSMGYRRLVTYTLAAESGTSALAAGYHLIGKTSGGSWDRPHRRRINKHPTGPKKRWERVHE